MKIIQIIGTRPNISKFINITGNDYVVWTGQHYDKEMFVKEIKIDKWLQPEEKLDCTGDLVIVYGDTFSALQGSYWAKEKGIPLAHIEAGVRLGEYSRPEERIRIEIDKLSDYLFCVNEFHASNLREEGIDGKIFVVGDLLFDQYIKNRKHKDYGVLTIHRREHLKEAHEMQKLFNSLESEGRLKFYCHPHTKKKINEFGIVLPHNIEMLDPISYEDIMAEIKDAKKVVTDSGGLTREAYFCGTPVKNIGKTEWSREIEMFGDGNAESKIREIIRRKIDLCQI